MLFLRFKFELLYNLFKFFVIRSDLLFWIFKSIINTCFEIKIWAYIIIVVRFKAMKPNISLWWTEPTWNHQAPSRTYIIFLFPSKLIHKRRKIKRLLYLKEKRNCHEWFAPSHMRSLINFLEKLCLCLEFWSQWNQ